MNLRWSTHTPSIRSPRLPRMRPLLFSSGNRGMISAAAAILFALSICGPASAQAVECKEVYRSIDFCPEALRGIDSIASDEKNRLLVSIRSHSFAISTSFFDGEGKRGDDLLIKKALFELLYVKNAIPDAEIVDESQRSVQSREATTFSKQNKTWNRKTVGHTTVVNIGDNALVVTTSRSAKDFSDLDSDFHEMALNAFRIRGDG